MAQLRRFFNGMLLLSLLFLCLSAQFSAGNEDVDDDEVAAPDGEEVGIVGGGVDEFFLDEVLESAPGVGTVYHFPKNPEKMIAAGDTTEVLVGLSNFGESSLKVTSIRASIHLPYDHRVFVQNFTVQEFAQASVPPNIQASFPYSFTVSKFLQPGSFALVASIFYEIDGQTHKSTFYNGTVEVVEAHGFFSGETIFLVTLGLGLTGFFGIWAHGQIQNLSKRARRTKKVETGTKVTDAASNEWLQGTSFTAKRSNSISQSSKGKKKKAG